MKTLRIYPQTYANNKTSVASNTALGTAGSCFVFWVRKQRPGPQRGTCPEGVPSRVQCILHTPPCSAQTPPSPHAPPGTYSQILAFHARSCQNTRLFSLQEDAALCPHVATLEGLTKSSSLCHFPPTMGPEGSLLSGGQMQITLWGSLAAVATFFLITFLIFLCSSCDR